MQSVFKKVSMKNVANYIKVPDELVEIRCQLGPTGPQFYQAKGNKNMEGGMK